MSLSTSAKDYIANHFGTGSPKCFVSGGISYTDPGGNRQTGSTQDVVATLKMNIGGAARGPGGEVYINIPDWSEINDADIVSIGSMQSGASQYCVGAAPPPSGCTVGTRRCKPGTTNVCQECRSGTPNYWSDVQTCPSGQHCSGGSCVVDSARPETGPLEVYVGGGSDCAAGAPSVTLDTSGAFAFFKSESYDYIGVGGIDVRNLDTSCRAHFAWEARVWDTPGYGYTSCPTSVPEMQEINRFLVDVGSRPLSTTMLNAGETDVVWGSFEITPGMEGEKTLCLSLWGNFSKSALIDELNATGYYDK